MSPVAPMVAATLSVARYGLCASLFAAWLTAAALPAGQVLGVHKRVLDDGSLLMINSTNQSQHIHDAMVKSKEIKAKDVRYGKMPPMAISTIRAMLTLVVLCLRFCAA